MVAILSRDYTRIWVVQGVFSARRVPTRLASEGWENMLAFLSAHEFIRFMPLTIFCRLHSQNDLFCMLN